MARHHHRQQNYCIQLLKMLQLLDGLKKLNPWVSSKNPLAKMLWHPWLYESCLTYPRLTAKFFRDRSQLLWPPEYSPKPWTSLLLCSNFFKYSISHLILKYPISNGALRIEKSLINFKTKKSRKLLAIIYSPRFCRIL